MPRPIDAPPDASEGGLGFRAPGPASTVRVSQNAQDLDRAIVMPKPISDHRKVVGPCRKVAAISARPEEYYHRPLCPPYRVEAPHSNNLMRSLGVTAQIVEQILRVSAR